MSWDINQEKRIRSIELAINTVQLALNKLATVAELNTLLSLRQTEIDEIWAELEDLAAGGSGTALATHAEDPEAHPELNDRYYPKNEYVDDSSGVADAGVPVKLNESGLIDSTMIGDISIPDTITLTNITQITNRSHANLQDLSADDHTQYHNDTRGDARYYTQSQHIDESIGLADASKPILLTTSGLVDDTMISSYVQDQRYWLDVTQKPFFAACDGGITDDAPALQAAIIAAQQGSVNAVLLPKIVHIKSHINSSLLDPNIPITFIIPQGGGIYIWSNPWTVKMYGEIQAGLYQIVWNASDASWSDSTIWGGVNPNLYPEWFGAKGDGDGAGNGTDDTQAIEDCLVNVGLGSTTTHFRAAVYNVSGAAGASLFSINTQRVSGQFWWRANQGGSIIYLIGSNTVDKVFYAASNRCEIENIIVLGNDLANYAIHLNTSHGTRLRNVSVQGTNTAGVYSVLGQVMNWDAVYSNSNNGIGIHIRDANASRFRNLQATLNGEEGVIVDAVAASGGVTIDGVNLETNCQTSGEADLLIEDVNSTTDILGLWIESDTSVNSVVLSGAHHVNFFGSRITGDSGKAIWLKASDISNTVNCNFYGVGIISGTSDADYEKAYIDSGSAGNRFYGCHRMVQNGGTGSPLVIDSPERDRNSTEQRHMAYGTSTPTSGTWVQGDIIWNLNVSNSTTVGWVCTTGGTVGNWRKIVSDYGAGDTFTADGDAWFNGTTTTSGVTVLNGTNWINGSTTISGLADGLVGSPSLAFLNDTDTGLYRVDDNTLGLTVGGTKVIDLTSDRLLFNPTFLGLHAEAPATDTFPFSMSISASDAYRGATSTKQTGGSLTLFGGHGIRNITIVDYSALVSGVTTVTISIDAVVLILTAVTGTPGTNEFKAEISNDVTATNLAAAIVANSVYGIETADSSSNIVRIKLLPTSRFSSLSTIANSSQLTVTNGIDGSVRIHSGTATTPSLAFHVDGDTGFYRPGNNNLGISVNGTEMLDVNTSGINSSGWVAAANGSYILLSIAEQTTGLVRTGVNEVQLKASGSGKLGWWTGGVYVLDAVPLYFGSGTSTTNAGQIQYNTVQNPDALTISTNTASRNVLLIEGGDEATNFAHAQQTNPTLWIQSANGTAPTQAINLSHDQTNAVISTSYGTINLNAKGITTSGYLSLGTDTFLKADGVGSGLRRPGEILLDNGTTDSPGIHFYTANNTNWGIDDSAGTLRFVSNLDESSGSVRLSMTTAAITSTLPIYMSNKILSDVAGIQNLTGNTYVNNDQVIAFGTSAAITTQSTLQYNTIQTPDCLTIALNTLSRNLIICEQGDTAVDFNHALQTNPTLWIQSADAINPSQNISITHNQTDGVITASGNIKLDPVVSTGQVYLPNAHAAALVNVGTASPTILPDRAITTVGIGSASTGGYMSFYAPLEVMRMIASQVVIPDTIPMFFGSAAGTVSSSRLQYNTSQTNDHTTWALGTANPALMFIQNGDQATDFVLPVQTNPSVIIQSSDATKPEQRMTITYSGLCQDTTLTDTTPYALTIKGSNAHELSTTNNTGGSIAIAAGHGRRIFNVISYAGLVGDTCTITTYNPAGTATSVTLTEGVHWTAAVDNATTAISIAAAINANLSTVTATASTTLVGVRANIGTLGILLATSDSTNLTLTQASAGDINIHLESQSSSTSKFNIMERGIVRFSVGNGGVNLPNASSSTASFTMNGQNIVGWGRPHLSASGTLSHLTALGGIMDNNAASGLITYTLPTTTNCNNAGNNAHYYFLVVDTDGIKIVANTGQTIVYKGRTSTSAGFIQSSQVGAAVYLVWISTLNQWHAVGFSGPEWFIDSTSEAATLGVGAATFAVRSDYMTITGDSGSNTITTITSGVKGMELILRFVDALVTITDDNSQTADTINLNGTFVSANRTILRLFHDGTSWHELSRSANG